MNKIILLGRLTKDPEIRYTQANPPLAIAKYTLAVNRKFKKDNEPDADFINCVAFGKSAEFAEKHFTKGQQVSVVGRLQVSTYTDKDGVKKWAADVIVEEQFFADSKRDASQKTASNDIGDEDLPF